MVWFINSKHDLTNHHHSYIYLLSTMTIQLHLINTLCRQSVMCWCVLVCVPCTVHAVLCIWNRIQMQFTECTLHINCFVKSLHMQFHFASDARKTIHLDGFIWIGDFQAHLKLVVSLVFPVSIYWWVCVCVCISISVCVQCTVHCTEYMCMW